MEKLILLCFDYLLIISYLLIGFVSFLFVQLICYRVFKFNLYKKIIKLFGGV